MNYQNRILLFVSIISLMTLPLFGQISDPIPGAITKSGLSVDIVDMFQVPSTSNDAPLAR